MRMSPCAYVAGLLHPLVMQRARPPGARVPLDPGGGGMFVPFEDGSSIQLWNDDERCEAEIRRFAPKDLAGWRAMQAVKRRLRDTLRPDGPDDLWLGPAPTREEIERRLGGDAEARGAAVRLVHGRAGRALPRRRADAPGLSGAGGDRHQREPARCRAPRRCGITTRRAGWTGMPGTWGYVEGGMGMVSFLLCDIAREAGAVVATRGAGGADPAGRGRRAGVGRADLGAGVVSNADPRRHALALLDGGADPAWAEQVRAVPDRGRDGQGEHDADGAAEFHRPARHARAAPHRPGEHAAQQDGVARPSPAGQRGRAAAADLERALPADGVRPQRGAAGVHTLSVFAQYVPYRFREGTWDTPAGGGRAARWSVDRRFCSNLPAAIIGVEVLGPPDIERGWASPAGTSSRARSCRTTCGTGGSRRGRRCPGVFLCGAGTHPGGSVIGINGRNAAMEALKGGEAGGEEEGRVVVTPCHPSAARDLARGSRPHPSKIPHSARDDRVLAG